MKGTRFKAILQLIEHLTHEQRLMLTEKMNCLDDDKKVCDIIEQRQESSPKCPHCGNERLYRHGKSSGLQRYKCRSCYKTFNALTGTPLAGFSMRKNWLSYISTLLESKTVRSAARSVGIHRNTSFRWRHRFLSWITNDYPSLLAGIVEADETYFLYSEKGNKKLDRSPHKRGGPASKRGLSKEHVCVLVAQDRSGNEVNFITGTGAVRSDWLQKNFTSLLASDCLLVTDGHSAYKKFCSENELSHEVVHNKTGKRVKGACHIQHVNAYHSRLKQWIRMFNGVATKYLDNYLAWRHELEHHCSNDAIPLLKASLGIFPQQKVT